MTTKDGNTMKRSGRKRTEKKMTNGDGTEMRMRTRNLASMRERTERNAADIGMKMMARVGKNTRRWMTRNTQNIGMVM